MYVCIAIRRPYCELVHLLDSLSTLSSINTVTLERQQKQAHRDPQVEIYNFKYHFPKATK